MNRLDKLEQAVNNQAAITKPAPTEEELTEDLAWEILTGCIYHIAEHLFFDDEFSLFNDWRCWLDNAPYVKEAPAIPDDLMSIFTQAAARSASHHRAWAVLAPDLSEAHLAAAWELEALDCPDLGREFPCYYQVGADGKPVKWTADDWLDFYRAYGWGTYGPKAPITKEPELGSPVYWLQGMEGEFLAQLRSYIEYYGRDIVGRFYNLEKIPRLQEYLQKRSELDGSKTRNEN